MQPQDANEDPSAALTQTPSQQIDEGPAYVKLWDRTKRYIRRPLCILSLF